MRRRTPLSPDRRTTNPIRGTAPAIVLGSGLAALGLAAGILTGVSGAARAAEAPPTTDAAVEHSTLAAAKPVAANARAQSALSEAAKRIVARDTAIRDEVAKRALAQVGDDYAAGATGPNAFDCSGLVVYAWRAAGVRLEHYSYAQYKETQRISVKDAVPGDLAFYFRNGAHHVGIYIGNGKIVNASDYGIGVIISPLKTSNWAAAHFTGMGRVKIPS